MVAVMLGVSTALLARGAGIVTQIVAVPVALQHLSHERFGVYLMLAGILNWILLAASGLSSALAKAIAGRNPEKEELRDLLGAAIAFVAMVGAVMCLVVSVIFVIWAHRAPSLPANLRDETLVAGLLMSLTLLAIVVLQVFEGVQNGRLKSYIINICRLVGSLASFILLFTVPSFWPAIGAFVLSLNGGLLIGAVLNAAAVARTLPPRFAHLRRDIGLIAGLLRSGAPFLFISTASLFQTYLPVFLLGAIKGPVSAVDFGLFVRGLVLLLSVAVMFTAPLWPALLSAEARGERAKAMKLAVPVGGAVLALALGAGLAIGLFGGQVLSLWTRQPYHGGQGLQAAFGVYIFLVLWSHFWAIMLMGQGRERLVAFVLFSEALAIAGLGSTGAVWHGATGMAMGMALAVTCASAWIFPVAALKRLLTGPLPKLVDPVSPEEAIETLAGGPAVD